MSPELPEGSGIWATVVTGIGSLLWLRRYLSRDRVAKGKDDAEINMLRELQHERNALLDELTEARKREVEIWQARNEDARLIGELTAQVAHQTQLIETLTAQVSNMRRDMHTLRDAIAVSKAQEVVNYLKDQGIDFDALLPGVQGKPDV